MAGKRKRVKKVSNGSAKGAKKSPMSEQWKILNGKGAFKALKPIVGGK